MHTKAYATFDEKAEFIPHDIQRRALRASDVSISIAFCGICHSDIHTAKSEWGPASYPCVPGHEIVGIVEAIGPKVTQFKVGDKVGLGCMVDACGACSSCENNEEQYCKTGFTGTYGSKLESEDEPTTYTLGLQSTYRYRRKVCLKNSREPRSCGHCSITLCRYYDLLL